VGGGVLSLRVVLSHYLATLKERDELDALLPDLLVAMDHTVLSRPQVGVGQAGVDVMSTYPSADGQDEVYLFIIKFGDVGREDMFTGKQAVQPSVREACTVFVRSRIPEPLSSAKKRLILLTNGLLKQEAQDAFSALSEEVARTPTCSLELWGLDTLVQNIEQHLVDEALLLDAGKAHLRSAIASLDDSSSAVSKFVGFLDSVFTGLGGSASPAIARKRFLKQVAGATMGWSVFHAWAREEGNLKPAADACEYLLLRVWSEAVAAGEQTNRLVVNRIDAVLDLLRGVYQEYFEKTLPQLFSKRMVLTYRREFPFYVGLVLQEAGRLACWALIAPGEDSEAPREALLAFLAAHEGAHVPVLDSQQIDVSLALGALLRHGDARAVEVLEEFTNAFLLATRVREPRLPVDTDLLEDALALHAGDELDDDLFQRTSYLPMLAAVAAVVGHEESLSTLRDTVVPRVPAATLERWYPAAAIELLPLGRTAVGDAGVSRALARFRSTCPEEQDAVSRVPAGGDAPEAFAFVQTGRPYLAAISARLYRHPIPPWLFRRLKDAAQVGGNPSSPTGT
jgi:hypothetical protein